MKMIIDGEHRDARDKKVVEVFDCCTNKLIDTVPDATKEDVEEAIAVAQTGKKIWAEIPIYERCEILKKFSEMMISKAEEIAEIESKETGRPLARCMGDVPAAANTFKRFAEAALHRYGEVMPFSEKGFQNDITFTMHEPLGVMACILPFNHPISLYSNKIAPALATGNAVIVKPPSDDPLVAVMMTDMLLEAGVPKEALQIVTGRGSTVGDWLVGNHGIDAVSFTGSTEVGKHILELGASYLHRTFLEMGGNDALIITEDANMDAAVGAAAVGRMVHSGQICISPKRIIVARSIKEEFVKRVIEKVDDVSKHSDLNDPAMIMSYLINEKAALQVEEQVAYTVKQGAKIVYSKERKGTFMYPVVLDDVTKDMDIAKDMEVFGPVVPIIAFDTIEEAIEIANASIYGLMGGVISGDYKMALKIASKLQSGGVVINGSGLYRTDEMPFGGYKASGIGREGIACALEEMTQIKTTIMKGVLA